MNKAVRSISNQFLLEYQISRLSLEKIIQVLQKQGYSIVNYSHLKNSEDVNQLLSSLGLCDMARRSKGFTYSDSNFRIVFVHESLSDEERLKVLAHEEGHIYLGHMTHRSIIGRDVTEEFDVNEFASYVLEDHPLLAIKLWIRGHKLAFGTIVASLFLLVAILVQYGIYKTNENQWTDYYITATGTKYHKENCIFIKGKANVHRLAPDELALQKYTPCQICLPELEGE